jgi:hypothetical protein
MVSMAIRLSQFEFHSDFDDHVYGGAFQRGRREPPLAHGLHSPLIQTRIETT